MNGLVYPLTELTEIVFDDLKQNFFLRLKQEVKDWLTQHSIRYELGWKSKADLREPFAAEIKFLEADAALLFKLTWL